MGLHVSQVIFTPKLNFGPGENYWGLGWGEGWARWGVKCYGELIGDNRKQLYKKNSDLRAFLPHNSILSLFTHYYTPYLLRPWGTTLQRDLSWKCIF